MPLAQELWDGLLTCYKGVVFLMEEAFLRSKLYGSLELSVLSTYLLNNIAEFVLSVKILLLGV